MEVQVGRTNVLRFNCLSPLFLPQLVCAVDLTDREQTAVSDRERERAREEREMNPLWRNPRW